MMCVAMKIPPVIIQVNMGLSNSLASGKTLLILGAESIRIIDM